jgi:hypothetical protein
MKVTSPIRAVPASPLCPPASPLCPWPIHGGTGSEAQVTGARQTVTGVT